MLKIGELAKICNISTQTLRYYDCEGILFPEKADNVSGYRYYGAKQIERLNDILRLKESKGLELVERNYFNAFIAEFITVDNYKKVIEDFYNYKIGSLTVEYMINECGGIEKFLTVYFDSIRTTELYSKDIDNLVLDAMAWNKKIYR